MPPSKPPIPVKATPDEPRIEALGPRPLPIMLQMFSWGMLWAAVLELMVATAAFVFVRPRLLQTMDEMGADLPALSQAILLVPAWLVVLLAIVLIAALVLKEIMVRPPRVKLLINLLGFFLAGLAVVLLILSLWLPLVAMIESTGQI